MTRDVRDATPHVKTVRDRETNPLIGLALRRAGEARGLVGFVIGIVALSGAAGVACAYSPLAEMFRDPFPAYGEPIPTPGELFLFGTFLAAFFVLTIMGVVPRAALAVTRDREQRALQPLLITRLSRQAVVAGKGAQAAMIPVLGVVALLPLLCLGLALGGVEVWVPIAAFAFLLLCLLFFTCAGLCVSAWCRRSVVALACAYGTLGLLCLGSPLADSVTFSADGSRPAWTEIARALNPLSVLSETVAPAAVPPFGGVPTGAPALASAVYLLLSLLFLALAARGLRPE